MKRLTTNQRVDCTIASRLWSDLGILMAASLATATVACIMSGVEATTSSIALGMLLTALASCLFLSPIGLWAVSGARAGAIVRAWERLTDAIHRSVQHLEEQRARGMVALACSALTLVTGLFFFARRRSLEHSVTASDAWSHKIDELILPLDDKQPDANANVAGHGISADAHVSVDRTLLLQSRAFAETYANRSLVLSNRKEHTEQEQRLANIKRALAIFDEAQKSASLDLDRKRSDIDSLLRARQDVDSMVAQLNLELEALKVRETHEANALDPKSLP